MQQQEFVVLIVEDEDMPFNLLKRRILSAFSYGVHCIRETNYQQAIERLISPHEDIAFVVLDLGLPGVEVGSAEAFTEIKAAIKKYGLSTQVTVISGTDDTEIIDRIRSAGSHFISKPDAMGSTAELIKLIQMTFAKRTSGSSGESNLYKDRVITLAATAERQQFQIDSLIRQIGELSLRLDSLSGGIYGSPESKGLDNRIDGLGSEIKMLTDALERANNERNSLKSEIKELLDALGYLGLLLKIWSKVWDRFTRLAKENPSAFFTFITTVVSTVIAAFHFLSK